MFDPGELLQLTNAQLRETVGTTVRELDACLGLPPFPNPSSPQCVSLARGLVNLLAHVNEKGHISTLGGLEEVKMTLPVLCASLRGGSLEQRPCPILMELLIEALCYVHGLSCYPLQSLLDDVKAIISQSPIALKFFALTGALDVETLCFFLGIPQSRCCKEKKQRRSRNANGKACKITQGSDVSKLSLKEPTGDLTVVPSSAMIKTALDVVLPEECMKFLLSLLNNSPSFQRVVGVDTVMATKILDVYGDHLIPCLHPVALISCLDVTLMDVFIDTVQLHGEKMTLFTEPAFTQCSIASWTADRLGHLVRYCVTRNIQPRDAFGSVVTYVYMYKVLTEWESCGKTPTNVTVDEEACLWRASVKAALLVRSSAPEVDRFVRPLCALVHYIRERHTNELLHGIDISQSHVSSGENVGALVKEISTILEDVRHSVAGARDTNNKSRRKKCKTKPSMNETAFSSASVCELYTQCKQAVDLLSLVAWLTTSEDEVVQNATWQQLELAAELILSAENGGSSGHVPIPAAALESFQHAFISLMYMRRKPGRGAVEDATQDTTVPFGKKCLAALVSAAHVTHRLDCFCHLVRRFPCTLSFLSQSLELYNVILFVWVNDAPPLHKFYEGPLPTPTHTVGLLLSLLCEERTDHLVQEIVDNYAIVTKLLPALQKLNGEGNVIDETARSGFLTLQRCLQRTLELRRKTLKKKNAPM
uniref:WGS project CAEQ00000000 data, annotated contig 1326 n=1 Tax=Trypanosoma congolense (strain IL3000) TaxID=1068625 RepID=F9W5H7_TRYCI|nr:unnamed protein product [Trypanosoma congolense IL3000]